ncbi:MAG: hypothetical protein HRT66_04465, partial [Flavobacteriaceae bacterium]|nr:hypothetical protein [Flavobacteriaceae bacterium]
MKTILNIKLFSAAIIGLIFLSCGSYNSVNRRSDGIYSSKKDNYTQTNQTQETYGNQEAYVNKVSPKSYEELDSQASTGKLISREEPEQQYVDTNLTYNINAKKEANIEYYVIDEDDYQYRNNDWSNDVYISISPFGRYGSRYWGTGFYSGYNNYNHYNNRHYNNWYYSDWGYSTPYYYGYYGYNTPYYYGSYYNYGHHNHHYGYHGNRYRHSKYSGYNRVYGKRQGVNYSSYKNQNNRSYKYSKRGSTNSRSYKKNTNYNKKSNYPNNRSYNKPQNSNIRSYKNSNYRKASNNRSYKNSSTKNSNYRKVNSNNYKNSSNKNSNYRKASNSRSYKNSST